MKILIAASEMTPFVSSGGLADFVQALSTQLAGSGHEVTVVLPYFRGIRENKALGAKRTKSRFAVDVGAQSLSCEVWEAAGPQGLKMRFLQREEFFDRSGLYGADDRDYQDNAARFIFFSKCVTELARLHLPDVVHLVGWQAAMAAVFVKNQKLPVPTVLFPYSLEFQGNFWSHDFALTNLPGTYFSAEGLEFYGSMNFLKSGIVFADAIALPGGRFAAEAQTPAHGCGLENVLRSHSSKIEGIAFGVDDRALPVVKSDAKSRAAALRGFFPDADPKSSHVFVVDALSSCGQGIDLLMQALDLLPSPDLRFVLLGEIPDVAVEALEIALRRHSTRLLHSPEVDGELLARVLSAGDFVLVPGPLEPLGVFVATSMRNGLVPVVEFCTGLLDLVRDFDPSSGSGNGLVYHRHTLASLADALKRALFLSPAERELLVQRAREKDFSWAAAISGLENLQQRLLRSIGRA